MKANGARVDYEHGILGSGAGRIVGRNWLRNREDGAWLLPNHL